MPNILPPEVLIPALLFAALMIGTPGPTNMILLTMGAQFGVRRTMRFIFGVNCGFLVVLSLVALGLGTLFEQFPPVRILFIFLSGGYLIYLAWKIANSPLPTANSAEDPSLQTAGFLKGVMAHALNPKTWATVTTAMAQFTDPVAAPVFLQAMMLGVLFVMTGVPINMVWTWAGDRIVGAIQNDRTRQMVNYSLSFLTVAIVVYMMAQQFMPGQGS